jgi:hypothetical protein
LSPLALLPDAAGLCLQRLVLDGAAITLYLQTMNPRADCPVRGQPAQRTHSRYWRKLTDLPWRSRRVVGFHVTRFGTVSRPCQPARPLVSQLSPRFITQSASAALQRIESRPTGTTPRRRRRATTLGAASPDTRQLASHGFSGSNTVNPSARAASRSCRSDETSTSTIPRPCKSRATAN